MSPTYGIDYTAKQNPVNLNYQINKFYCKNYKKHVLWSNAGDGL